MMNEEFDMEKARAEMQELLTYKMPFGRFKNQKLVDLPIDYLIWFRRKGFPDGKLGKYLQIVLEMKS